MYQDPAGTAVPKARRNAKHVHERDGLDDQSRHDTMDVTVNVFLIATGVRESSAGPGENTPVGKSSTSVVSETPSTGSPSQDWEPPITSTR